MNTAKTILDAADALTGAARQAAEGLLLPTDEELRLRKSLEIYEASVRRGAEQFVTVLESVATRHGADP